MPAATTRAPVKRSPTGSRSTTGSSCAGRTSTPTPRSAPNRRVRAPASYGLQGADAQPAAESSYLLDEPVRGMWRLLFHLVVLLAHFNDVRMAGQPDAKVGQGNRFDLR